MFALISMGLSWAAGTYAVGSEPAGQQIAVALRHMPDVTVFSDKDLNLAGRPGARCCAAQAPSVPAATGKAGRVS